MARSTTRALRKIAKILNIGPEGARRYCERIQNIVGTNPPSFWTIAVCLQRSPKSTRKDDRAIASRAQRLHEKKKSKRASDSGQGGAKQRSEQGSSTGKPRERRVGRRTRSGSWRTTTVQVFSSENDRDQQQTFNQWLYANWKGYVLNVRGEQERPILHRATCDHLRSLTEDRRDFIRTPKYCAANRQELKTLARKKSEHLMERCHHCDP